MIKINYNFICLSLTLLIISTNLFSQQLPTTNHYILNSYAINPAIGGSRPYYEIKSNHRYQWVGLQDAPRTYVLSLNGPLLSNMGVGALIHSDNIGPISNTGVQFSYSYHIKLREKMNLSFGLALGFLHYSLDAQKLILNQTTDIVISENVQSVLLPDAKFGVYFSAKDFFIGLSVPQLIQSKIKLSESEGTAISRLKSHYYLMGGYKYSINSSFDVEPSFLLKYISPVRPQLDISGRIIYEDRVWLAASYRTNDAITTMIGCDIKSIFSIAYSYEFVSSNLKNYSQGSHEIMLGIRLKKFKKDVSKPGAIQSNVSTDNAEKPQN